MSRFIPCQLSVLDDKNAIHQDIGNAFGILMRLKKCGCVLDGLRIEDNDIRMKSFSDHAAVAETEYLSWQ